MNLRLPITFLIFAISAISAHAVDRPNIVLVMADDQGWGDTAYNGHPELVTPHLAAQKAGKDYHDAKRLMLDAGEIKTQYDRDKHQGHSAWLDWPWKLHQISGG